MAARAESAGGDAAHNTGAAPRYMPARESSRPAVHRSFSATARAVNARAHAANAAADAWRTRAKPLRERVAEWLADTEAQFLIDVLQTFLSLVSCGFYVWQTYERTLFQDRPAVFMCVAQAARARSMLVRDSRVRVPQHGGGVDSILLARLLPAAVRR